MDRTSPFGSYNFQVDLQSPGVDIDSPFGGFAEVSGLNTELTVAEYRNGNDAEPRVRKVSGIYKVGDVTLKRGILNSTDLWQWISQARTQSVKAQRVVTITLRDEAGEPVESWKLRGCIPLKYSGPTLTGKGGGDVAMEELTLSVEAISFQHAQGSEIT